MLDSANDSANEYTSISLLLLLLNTHQRRCKRKYVMA